MRYPWRAFAVTTFAFLGLTWLLLPLDISFTAKAMPIAIAPVLPAAYTVYCYLWKARSRLTPLMMVHAGVLFAMAIHRIDFAVFRMEPSAQLWGWPIAYGLYQLTAVLFPALTLDHLHREEQSRLKSIIEERTSEITAANQRLHHLFREKDFLFKALTHDISNPLTVIRTKASMPEVCLANPGKFLNDVRNMTERISGLIQQVRDYDSIEKRLLVNPPEDIRLLDVLRDCEFLFADRLAEKSIEMSYDPNELESLVIRVERASFTTSVLPNLLSNAIKFSRGHGRIQIYARMDEEHLVTLCIEDAGIGIPEVMRDKLFDFGANVSRLGTAGEPGTGFGLPILARVIRAYKREVHVASRVESSERPGMTRVDLILPGFHATKQRSA